jgi:parvulin-like peptidyl-prolyl isomerase
LAGNTSLVVDCSMNGTFVRYLFAAAALACLLNLAVLALGQDEPNDEPDPKADPLVVATVNGDPVYIGEIEAGYAELSKLRGATSGGPDYTKAKLLRDTINKRLVEQAMERDGSYVDQAQVNREMARIEAQLKEARTTLAAFSRQRGVGPEVARHEVVWALTWNKYLERNLSDALEAYFNQHRQDLDGTEVRASHILLRPQRSGDSKNQIKRAEQIRAEIESGKLTFEQAAEKFSAGPSREQGGDLGFFPRHGVMAEPFSTAAFKLKKGEISQPVVTHFGTHLIRVTEVKPGAKQWTEVVDAIKTAAAKDLFDRIAAEELETAHVEFTGRSPYFKPGTEEVVLPTGAAKPPAAAAAKSAAPKAAPKETADEKPAAPAK